MEVTNQFSTRHCGSGLASLERIVDFGSGWGRISRMLLGRQEAQRIYALDVDRDMTALVNVTLPGINAVTIDPEPPTVLADSSIGGAVAFSVFSHLSGPAHEAWAGEMGRIIAPGGFAAITVLDDAFFGQVARARDEVTSGNADPFTTAIAETFPDLPRVRAGYERGEIQYAAGGEYGARSADSHGWAVAPTGYVERVWRRSGFRVVEWVPSGVLFEQALVFLVRAGADAGVEQPPLPNRSRIPVVAGTVRRQVVRLAGGVRRRSMSTATRIRVARARPDHEAPETGTQLRDRRGYVVRNPGWCPCCRSNTIFQSTSDWLRDNYVCTRCFSIPRQRHLQAVLDDQIPGWESRDLHESSPSNDLIRRWSRAYTCSQYFPDVPRGGLAADGTRCEDIESLTFADESLDIFVTQDVLEHVFHPGRAIAEIHRVLRPGGAHVFTTPVHPSLAETIMRARVDEHGVVEHLAPPAYHGNPIGDNKALVTFDYGQDFEELLRGWAEAAGDAEVRVVRTVDRSRGIDAEHNEVFLVTKPSI